jgi:acetolactate synthase-1/3 small subunit
LDYTETRCIERELLLVKVSILGPEYVEEQLAGGPFLAPRQHRSRKLQQEMVLAQHFEHAADPAPHHDIPAALTPTQTLQLKSQNLQSIIVLAAQFGGKIVDVSENSVIVELAGKSSRMNAFLSLLKPFGILESARTGQL